MWYYISPFLSLSLSLCLSLIYLWSVHSLTYPLDPLLKQMQQKQEFDPIRKLLTPPSFQCKVCLLNINTKFLKCFISTIDQTIKSNINIRSMGIWKNNITNYKRYNMDHPRWKSLNDCVAWKVKVSVPIFFIKRLSK